MPTTATQPRRSNAVLAAFSGPCLPPAAFGGLALLLPAGGQPLVLGLGAANLVERRLRPLKRLAEPGDQPDQDAGFQDDDHGMENDAPEVAAAGKHRGRHRAVREPGAAAGLTKDPRPPHRSHARGGPLRGGRFQHVTMGA